MVPPRVSTAMADRLAERTAMRRHRTWRRVLAWLLALVLVGGLAWVALWSPVLALEKADVTVSGAGRYVDEDRVREIAEAPDGTPLPRLDTVAMREEVLGLRGVKDVRIARAWPHGLAVEITSRVPVAAVPDGDRLALLDSSGVRVATRDAAPKGLPQVDVPLDDALALQAALHVLAALPAKLAGQVEHVSADTQDAVETVLEDGTTVRWGGSSDLPLKVEAVRTLRKLDEGARTIDVSSPELPVTR
ncbi:MAG TPA: FtsQ-type POTRA domain-containing protein [Isoptericola sp.]|nr:FtsQ-type POTRA domain-containing protein [Isoptericola sp.]